MKRKILITTILLSFVLVMTLGVVSAVCGNGTVDTDHACDDGNTVSGDGCSADCQEIESDIQVDNVNVPTDTMCGDNSGLKCDETAADNYCKDGMTYKYDGYVTNSKVCINATTTSASKADAANAAIGSCDTGLSGHQWITSMKCYKIVGVCTENDTSTDLAEHFVFGNASAGGVDWLDSCIAGTDDKLNESYCDADGQLNWREVTCSEGCSDGVCEIPGLYCDADAILALPQVAPESRDRADNGDLYYCGLDEVWHLAKPTIDDISCIAADTCDSESKCLASYECISNSCVDEYCISITGELQEQRGILVRIWCFLTNMGDYFDLKVDYCGCVMDDDDAFWNIPAEQCDVST